MLTTLCKPVVGKLAPPKMKGSPCCAGLMWSCLHTYRTKTNLTQHIIQPWGGGHQASMGGPSVKYGGAISQVWGGSSAKYGGAISQVWGGHQLSMGGVSIFPPVCTGSQNPQNYFSNTYVLPSVNRTAGPMIGEQKMKTIWYITKSCNFKHVD